MVKQYVEKDFQSSLVYWKSKAESEAGIWHVGGRRQFHSCSLRHVASALLL